MHFGTPFRLLVPVLLPAIAFGCGDDSPQLTAPASAPALATASAALVLDQLSAGSYTTCGLTLDHRAWCWGVYTGDGTDTVRYRPVAVATTLRFRHISSGNGAVCAVTTDFVAYCWGVNDFGVLGISSTTRVHRKPVKVAGGLRFRTVETNLYHTCGLSYPDSKAYCWGSNSQGELGDGTRTDRLTPVPVTRGLTFRQLAAGGRHTCGVTSDDFLFCWGLNNSGQVGDSSTSFRRIKPALVSRGVHWHQVDAGARHTCAVTTADAAYCWGDGRDGQLGNGKQYLSFWPRKVAGGIAFTRVTAGGTHSCGESRSDLAYCWGGGSGLGSPGFRLLLPAAVAGGHQFAQVNAGTSHTCAKDEAGAAWCWGVGDLGQIGDGDINGSLEPKEVLPPQ
jgi:hypothetical protein